VRVLALDVGSSSVRVRGFAEDGTELEGVGAQRQYDEADPERLVEAVRETVEQGRGSEHWGAAGTCAFWHSLLAVDARGRPISPLLTWGDLRSTAQAAELARRLDPDEVHARTGCFLHPSFWPAKLAWLRAEQPDVFRSAMRFVSFSDFLYDRLVGATHTSLSMASGTGLLDLGTGTWDDELLEALELTPDRLPEVSDEPAGAEEPWFPALGDGACSNVGAGCTTPERAALMVGTSGAFRTIREAEGVTPRPGLFCYRLDERRVVEGGSLSDGGNLFAWLGGTLAGGSAEEVADRPPVAHGLTFLPLLGGERSPGWRPEARGAISGLTFATTPRDLVQAALEGIAYRFAEVADLMPEVREVVATGHALLEDPDWIQILADVLERPVTASAVAEGSAYGAAIMALTRLGAKPPPSPLGRVFEPRADRAEAHRAARERQRALYEMLA
jgi:gluconokinase